MDRILNWKNRSFAKKFEMVIVRCCMAIKKACKKGEVVVWLVLEKPPNTAV